MENRLFRSQKNAILGGVCGGLAKYLDVDAVLVRLFFVLLALGNGIGVLIYFLLWMIVPLEGQKGLASLEDNIRIGSQEIAERTLEMRQDLAEMVHGRGSRMWLALGSALILLGVMLLLNNLHLPWLRWFNFDVLWPLVLIFGGLALLLRRNRAG